MRTLQEKYNAILENKFSKSQFVRDARLELPNLISNFNGFEDTVTILKNRSMIHETKKKETMKSEDSFPEEAVSRGVDYELQVQGINIPLEMPNDEELEKAKTKVVKNLSKDLNFYLNLLSGESKNVDKHDKYVEAKKGKEIDTFNGMKKAELRETLHKLVKKALQEGRRAKIKGGKVVTENDYETGGYVESMGPELDKVVKHLQAVWNEWKNGPMTEPEMVTFAKADLVNYLKNQLKEIDESFLDEAGLEEKKGRDLDKDGDIDSNDYLAARDNAIKNSLKESFKKLIRGILTEEKRVLLEAKAENLESFINYENVDNEDLAARIRKGATELAEHIAKIEKAHLDARQGIEAIYANIGSFMAPAVSVAFKKDLQPVLSKYMTIELPKSKRISPEELEKLGIDPTQAGNSMYKVNENKGKKSKYTKRKN